MAKERKIYDWQGAEAAINKLEVSSKYNLENAIKYPLNFYHVYDSPGILDHVDWYSNDAVENDFLWNKEDNTKGIYVPCPEGWRVPDNKAWHVEEWKQGYRSEKDGLDLDQAGEKGDFIRHQAFGKEIPVS